MLNKKTLAAARIASGAVTDADFEYVTMLLHGDGTNGAQNNTFIDGSTNNFTITRTGNTSQGSFNPFGNLWSNFFDGTDDYLSVADNVNLRLGSGAFTIEAWVFRQASGAAHTIFAKGGASTGVVFQITSTNTLRFTHTTSNIDSTGTVAAFTWVHVAVVREGTGTNETKLYINGTQDGQGTVSTDFTQTEEVRIGTDRSAGADFSGYISNLRLVKGSAVYTASFTPPTAPLTAITNTSLLTCQSNRFRDASSNNFTVVTINNTLIRPFNPFSPTAAYSASTNGGSGYFDGNGDFISLASNTALAMGSGDFTVECWMYRLSTATMAVMDYNGLNGFGFVVNSTQIIGFASQNTAYTATATVVPMTWNHIAFSRSGTTLKTFLNGAEVGSFTVSTNFTSPNSLIIGRNAGSGLEQFAGYLSNLRLVKGTALYTAAFTPPTAPLTAITNTTLLLNFINGGIIDNAMDNVLETVGNAQISTSVKKYGTGSLAFDGTGDWLLTPDSVDLRLGTGNFTIEFWLYLSATGTARGIVGKGASTTGWLVSTNSSNNVVFTYGRSTITSTGTLSASTWYHVAVVRSGTGSNQTKIYIDGTNDGTGTVSTDFTQTEAMYIGANRTGGDALNGYIDDLRITKGVARYTANFTPPTAAFPDL